MSEQNLPTYRSPLHYAFSEAWGLVKEGWENKGEGPHIVYLCISGSPFYFLMSLMDSSNILQKENDRYIQRDKLSSSL